MFNFPWTNFHELNLDWILSVVKEAKEVFDTGRSDIDYAVETADEAKTIATQAAEATIADNSISTSKLQDSAVTSAKLANNSVTSAKIVDGTITGNDIAENTITNYNIQNGSLLGVDLADETITTDKLANGAVTYAKLFDDAVNTSKIADGAVITSKLADNAVTTAKIADSAVTTAKIPNEAVTMAKLASSVQALINKISTISLRNISVAYSVSSSSSFSTNVKTLIDADMPSGYKCLGLAGYSTFDEHVFVTSLRYADSGTSLQLGATTSSTVSNNISVFYLCMQA